MNFLFSYSRFNNLLELNHNQKKIYYKNNNYFKNSFFEHNLCKIDEKILGDLSTNNCIFLKNSFVYVITETVAEYPYPYFSEKTWKAILVKTPFMIVGAKNSLCKLKDFGFLTFENFWDESYDNLETAADRCDSIVNNLKYLESLDKSYIDNMYQEMLPILEHNFSNLENLRKKELEDVIKCLES
jgi:hypothetical protein